MNGEVWADGERRDLAGGVGWARSGPNRKKVRKSFSDSIRIRKSPSRSRSRCWETSEPAVAQAVARGRQKRQREVAGALDRAIDERGVRLIHHDGRQHLRRQNFPRAACG